MTTANGPTACVHSWSDWFCRVYEVYEFRLCRRCGGIEERQVVKNLTFKNNIILHSDFIYREHFNGQDTLRIKGDVG